MFIVEVHDLPDTPLSRARHFRLGPFRCRKEAETLAARAAATQGGTTVRVIEVTAAETE